MVVAWNKMKIFDAEYRFMDMIWQHAPVSSTELVRLAKEELGWKKSTTYTVIRRLCERGAISNQNALVQPLIDKEQVMRVETEELLDKVYSGSLKLFFTSFLQKEKLSPDEVAELKKIVEQYGKEE
ncbi:MAG: putative transcriptional regulator [Paenibacillaceae bacterium]|jgi:predicted transcriptional regulator|nr:putative transcriptional regulator [Paenibacillaceae bacterium]